MKTKKEILKMSKEELILYKQKIKVGRDPFDCSGCSDCFRCSDCYDCSSCYDCSGCYLCKHVKGLKYAICNVELTKKEYENKIKELKK